MKKFILCVFAFFFAAACPAQQLSGDSSDTAYFVQLNTVKVTARWRSDADRYHYNQMKYYITTILPYVDAATRLYKDVNAKVSEAETGKKEKRRYIAAKENEMRSQFTDKIKDLNVTQGALLVKLIARQTNSSIYNMLINFKNPMIAVKWQLWARLNGISLDRRYDPALEPDIENIMLELGYPLPDSYVAKQ